MNFRSPGAVLLFFLLVACSSPQPVVIRQAPQKTKVLAVTPITPAKEAVPKPEEIIPLSPYSSDGLMALNQFRSNNMALNDFLIRNRKPDYFFSSANTEFKYQKIYLVYLASDNLYLFDPQLSEPYKKFHPLPGAIKTNLDKILNTDHHVEPSTGSIETSPPENLTNETIEENLSERKPVPYLDQPVIQALTLASSDPVNNPIYPKLLFLDKNLNDVLENAYSAKYEVYKKKLKLIIPRAYETGGVYKDKSLDARKIYLDRNLATGKETVLIVPDFFPGSSYYKNTHGKVIKAFASLYEVDVAQHLFDDGQLRVRYSIKICQKDDAKYCATKVDGNIYIRAIVIAATLYDGSTNTVIDTFVLK